MMAIYDLNRKPNWSFVTPIECPDGTHFIGRNFTQESPWTEPFVATGLVFEDCNLLNCLLPVDALVIMAGHTKSLPTLADGRQIGNQHQYRIDTELTEEEPGVWAQHEIQKRYHVTGTPEEPVETYAGETDLGPAL